VSTILMTGASRGIGLHAARKMLDERPDLRLIVVARGEQPELPRTTVVRGDLASLRGVRAIAGDIDEPLDGFVGNAGAQLKTGNTSTVDGYETTFAVNVQAQHLLLSQLPFTGAARIVLTTSDSHFGRSRRTLESTPKSRPAPNSLRLRSGPALQSRAPTSTAGTSRSRPLRPTTNAAKKNCGPRPSDRLVATDSVTPLAGSRAASVSIGPRGSTSSPPRRAAIRRLIAILAIASA
jgi:NAD(P)-dependent dehydrogenase (short-subunit alcohol dehydrogenase family)